MMSALYLCRYLLFSINRRFTNKIQFVSICSHLTKSSETACNIVPLQNAREDIRLLRKYKRKLLTILCSDEFNEQLNLVKIANISNTSEGRALAIYWTLDERASDELIAHKIDAFLQANSKIIKEKLELGNAYRKLPHIEFIRVSSEDQLDHFKGKINYQSCEIIKPTTVYGLNWLEFAERIRTKPKGENVTLLTEDEEHFFDENNAISRKSNTTKWAKMWREQNNSRLTSRRERKKSHQMLGLWNLEKELEELE